MATKKILVTGAGGSAGMNFIESLRYGFKHGAEQFGIIGLDCSKYYAKLSAADKTYVGPPWSDPQYIGFLNGIIAAEGITFVHAQPDPEVLMISENREKINARLCLPSKEAIRIAQDKYRFNKLMDDKKVRVPATIQAEYIDGKGLFENRKKHWLRANAGAGSLAALPVTSYDQVNMWIDYWVTKGLSVRDFIISEFLPGREYAYQSIWIEGNLIAAAARQRLEYLFQSRMPSGQSSTPTIAKSVHDDRINELAEAAIKALDPEPNGIYCVDMKEDEKGFPCVTEINAGRFFTTSLFFTMAGCNMPLSYVNKAHGECVSRPCNDAVPADIYWIRQIDCGQVMVRGNELS